MSDGVGLSPSYEPEGMLGGKFMGAPNDSREIPEYIEFEWTEWPYPFPDGPTDLRELEKWQKEVEMFANTLPRNSLKVRIRDRQTCLSWRWCPSGQGNTVSSQKGPYGSILSGILMEFGSAGALLVRWEPSVKGATHYPVELNRAAFPRLYGRRASGLFAARCVFR